MRIYGIAVLLTCGSACFAQSSPVPDVQTSSLNVILSGSCPIGIDVRQQQRAPLLLTDTSGSGTHPAYTVSLQDFGKKAIREAVVDFVGPTGLHFERTSDRNADQQNGVERFTLSRMSNPGLTTTRLTAVIWIDLVKITYVDGTTWVQGPQAVCRVPLNGSMLVTSGSGH